MTESTSEKRRIPRLGRRVLGRAAIAGVVIASISATAVTAAILLEIGEVKNNFLSQGRAQIKIPEITRADAGGPRTIMLLGSDQRKADRKYHVPGRSDTILLARLDPDKEVVSLMSIPRDLIVDIPGHARQKINAAYAYGGARLTVRTVKNLFAHATGQEFHINNVVNVNFMGFRRSVDYVKGVYLDIDHRYFNNNVGHADYATINIKAGYQKLHGADALDYVRFRHTDTDYLRSVRQQEFMRQFKAQSGVQKMLDLGKRNQVARLLGRFTSVDQSFRSTSEIISLLKLLIYTRNKPVREVTFRSLERPSDAVATTAEVRASVHEFLNPKPKPKPKPRVKVASAKSKGKSRSAKSTGVPIGLEAARREGEDQAIILQPKLHFPLYFPTLRTRGSAYRPTDSRIYHIKDETGRRHRAYRLVISRRIAGEYYGIQGLTWRNPPILDHPIETRVVKGRRLLLFGDGHKLRLVAFKTNDAAYWVSNTLSLALTNEQMVSIAASLRPLARQR